MRKALATGAFLRTSHGADYSCRAGRIEPSFVGFPPRHPAKVGEGLGTGVGVAGPAKKEREKNGRESRAEAAASGGA